MLRWIGLTNNIRACVDIMILCTIMKYRSKENCCVIDGSFPFSESIHEVIKLQV